MLRPPKEWLVSVIEDSLSRMEQLVREANERVKGDDISPPLARKIPPDKCEVSYMQQMMQTIQDLSKDVMDCYEKL